MREKQFDFVAQHTVSAASGIEYSGALTQAGIERPFENTFDLSLAIRVHRRRRHFEGLIVIGKILPRDAGGPRPVTAVDYHALIPGDERAVKPIRLLL